MTRMYLSPTASVFVKVGLILIECLIGLYNLITFPIRMITLKAYGIILIGTSILYTILFYNSILSHLWAFGVVFGVFTAAIVLSKLFYKLLNKKVAPRIAYLINSPLGIQMNRYHVSSY